MIRGRIATRLTPYMFILPAGLILAIFSLGAMLFALYLSFHNWSINDPNRPFVGFQNYYFALTDRVFLRSIFNTFEYAILHVAGSVVAALSVALFIKSCATWLRNVLRSTVFLPVMTSVVAASIIWNWIYNPMFGPANGILAKLGLPLQGWLFDVKLAMPSIVIMTVWKGLGYGTILFLAGLYSIPEEYYEAARVDGAGAWQTFWSVTLPLLKPTTFFVVVTGIIYALQVFTEPFILTFGTGFPGNRTLTMVLHMYNTAFKYDQIGLANAMAFVLFAIILLITVLAFKVSKWEVEY